MKSKSSQSSSDCSEEDILKFMGRNPLKSNIPQQLVYFLCNQWLLVLPKLRMPGSEWVDRNPGLAKTSHELKLLSLSMSLGHWEFRFHLCDLFFRLTCGGRMINRSAVSWTGPILLAKVPHPGKFQSSRGFGMIDNSTRSIWWTAFWWSTMIPWYKFYEHIIMQSNGFEKGIYMQAHLVLSAHSRCPALSSPRFYMDT